MKYRSSGRPMSTRYGSSGRSTPRSIIPGAQTSQPTTASKVAAEERLYSRSTHLSASNGPRGMPGTGRRSIFVFGLWFW
jgi:hypothetical protein